MANFEFEIDENKKEANKLSIATEAEKIRFAQKLKNFDPNMLKQVQTPKVVKQNITKKENKIKKFFKRLFSTI